MKGPQNYNGFFIDAPEKAQRKHFTADFLYEFEPIGTGNVEIIYVAGNKVTARQSLRANNGSLPPPNPTTTKVPVVPNLSQSSQVLAFADLLVGTVTEETSTLAAGLITKQSPQAGTEVAKQSKVDLWVSKGSTPVEPSPFPMEGFRVLIVYEGDLTKVTHTPAQQNIMFGQKLRDFLNEKCVKVNNTTEARMYAADTDVSKDSDTWRNAMARPRTSLPWIIVGNGKSGFEGPLPATLEETLTLLKKYSN